jgi:superfamily II DNA or RNA helicase
LGPIAHAPGTLVKARGRDWIVLPPQEPEVLRLRPLTGGDGNEVGLFLPIEEGSIESTKFSPPDPQRPGDATGSLLLFDAARLSLRTGATPFRSLGRLSVTPRPYQFVPLIMALRLDPVRLLIADDVGVGKTIEAAMIARELLDRGIARRLAVICPAHLCDQWERELQEKFVLEPAVVQPSRIARLQRDLPRADLSIFQYYPHLVVSIDFIKSGWHRDLFIQNAPDLIIVDEAHMAARPRGDIQRVQQQRYAFLRELASDPGRHLLLVTATPHSGIEESFRSLLGLLDPKFDLTGPGPPQHLDRKILLPHIVQRRRRDLEKWLGTNTPFPERESKETKYSLAGPYLSLFNDVLTYCRESVASGRGLRAQQQRVRHWAAIALLRCLLSSPDAAVAVLGGLAERKGYDKDILFESGDEVDQTYRPQVLDPSGEEDVGDCAPTAPVEDTEAQLSDAEKRRLGSFLRHAMSLAGPEHDKKFAALSRSVDELLREEYRPIVFCRFIPTAKYLETWLARVLASKYPELRVIAVTGEIGEEERRAKVDELSKEPIRVLVATDCLSEGINLQEHFDAVIHYDLPWNPNRLEQREGRVDRFGQRRSQIKVELLYGANNQVDQVVLEVLIRKARTIRKRLGIAVPVPTQAEQVIQAVVDSVLLRSRRQGVQLELEFTDPEVSHLHAEWEAAADREGKQRAYFRQQGIQPDEVRQEMEATDPVLGEPAAVQRFLGHAAQRFGGQLRETGKPGVFNLVPGDLAKKLGNLRQYEFPLRVTFDRLLDETAVYLGRTHPLIETCCTEVIDRAFSPEPHELFSRAGAMFTNAVSLRTAVLLLRLRYLLKEQVEEFAEEIVLAGFQRQKDKLVWLEPLDQAARTLVETAKAAAPMPAPERSQNISWALEMLQEDDWFQPIINWRVSQVQDSHHRLRKLVNAPKLTIQPHRPPDILGCYVLVPAGGSS